jgi:hypothetical protein
LSGSDLEVGQKTECGKIIKDDKQNHLSDLILNFWKLMGVSGVVGGSIVDNGITGIWVPMEVEKKVCQRLSGQVSSLR